MKGLMTLAEGYRDLAILVGRLVAIAMVGWCFVGCDTLTTGPAPQPEEPGSPAPVVEATATRESSPTPQRVQARVVDVVDGDTVRVNLGGEVHALRYVGINAPERDQWMGPEATRANADLVEGQTVYLEVDVSETDQYGRLLRYVYLSDGTFVNAELVRWGYARAIEYEPDVKYQALLFHVEREARENDRGIWGGEPASERPAAPRGQAQVVVDPGCCEFDAPGTDDDNKEEEYVCFANAGDADVEMSGWRIQDEYGWAYTFPGFVLGAGARVQVATGCGSNTSDLLFWCKDGTAVWNNDGDTVFLYDSSGALVDTYSY
jgi:micrococcal nuclease